MRLLIVLTLVFLSFSMIHHATHYDNGEVTITSIFPDNN
jgi:hypothetical protein